MSALEFVECAACRKRPGSVMLCDACVQNRRAIAMLTQERDHWRTLAGAQPRSGELAAIEPALRSVLGELREFVDGLRKHERLWPFELDREQLQWLIARIDGLGLTRTRREQAREQTSGDLSQLPSASERVVPVCCRCHYPLSRQPEQAIEALPVRVTCKGCGTVQRAQFIRGPQW